MNITSEEYRKLIANKPSGVRAKKTKADAKSEMWLVMNSIIGGWETEFKFHPKRKWRADYYNKRLGVLVEYEGIYGGLSRHTNNIGYTRDCEKYNSAQILGYTVLRYTASNYKQLGDDLRALIKK